MILSVCVIMKNSEKILRDCLESIKDIIKRDDTELIIADTGSEDSSKEIAAAYTDKIFDFKWCDDFSAARNFCIEKSNGEWIFFIDTDEILENPSALNEFIDTEKSGKDYAFTVLRKYDKGENSEYTDTFPIRLFKKSGARYKNAVYEVPDGVSDGIKTDIIIKHNFVFNADRFYQFDDILKKALDKDSNNWWLNLKMMEHSSMKKEMADIEKYGNRAVELAGDNIEYRNSAGASLIKEYMRNNNYYNAELLIKQYISDRAESSLYDFSVFARYIDILHSIVRYDDIDNIYKPYLSLFDTYKKGEFDNKINQYLCIEEHSKTSLRKTVIRYINSLTGRRRYKEAEEMLLNELPLDIYKEDFSDFDERIRCELNWIQKGENSEKFTGFLEKSMKINKSKTIEVIDSVYKDVSSDISEELTVFYKNGGNGAYESVLKLRYADLDGKELDEEEAYSYISSALTEYKYAKDILYYIFKYNYPVTEWTDKIDPFYVSELFNVLASYSYKNPLKMAEDYLAGLDEIHTMQDIIAISVLYEIIFERLDAQNADKDKAVGMFENYIMVMNQYIHTVYKENVLNDEDIYSLSANIIFAYFGAKALDEKYAGNISAYLANLNKAVRAKQSFNPIIMVLLNSAKELIELTEQYKKIKLLIRYSIKNGEITDAYNYLNEYARMNPNDPELETLVDMLEEAAK